MSYRIHLRSDAETDIEEAAIWYERQREGLGHEFLDEVQSVFEKITDNPYTYSVVHRHCCRAIIHRFPFGIYYRIDEKEIVVFAVLHGSRHPKRWQQRK